MNKVNIKNERIKHKFYRYLKEAGRACEATVNCVEKAILLYEEFSGAADFKTFNIDKATDFKKWLSKREHKGIPLSLSTYSAYLRHLRKFFLWLSWQPGYKSRIRPDVIEYLNLSEKEERIVSQNTPVNFPQLEYVKKMADSIQIKSEIDLRDRALIAFTLLSGMRDTAIATLPLGCVDENTFIVTQNPKEGVQTKFSKYIYTILFKFDNNLLTYLLEWMKHLKTKGFGSSDPLFPRSKSEQDDGLSFKSATEIEATFWKNGSRIREIFKQRAQLAGIPYFRPHTFRHLAVDLAFKYCRSGDQIKAISQNFGHEHIATTLSSYGNYDQNRLAEILKHIDFSGTPQPSINEEIKELKEITKKLLAEKIKTL